MYSQSHGSITAEHGGEQSRKTSRRDNWVEELLIFGGKTRLLADSSSPHSLVPSSATLADRPTLRNTNVSGKYQVSVENIPFAVSGYDAESLTDSPPRLSGDAEVSGLPELSAQGWYLPPIESGLLDRHYNLPPMNVELRSVAEARAPYQPPSYRFPSGSYLPNDEHIPRPNVHLETDSSWILLMQESTMPSRTRP